MKKLKETMRFIFDKLKRSGERFPLTLAMTLLLMMVTIVLVHLDYNSKQQDFYQKLALTFALGIPMTAAGKLLIERYNLKGIKGHGVQLSAVVLTLLYYLTIPEVLTPYFAMRYMALWAILFFAFLMVPYFYEKEGLSRYILHLVGRFFLTVLYAGVIMGGISMIIFSIDQLFGVNWWDEIYMDAFILISGAFGVTYFLGSVPEIGSELPTEGFSKVFKGMFLYILLPILSVYTVILYAYFVKILFNFKLPDGVIGNLVLWYALVSIITLFFVRDLRIEVPWLSKFFKTYIPLMSIPLVMLFISLFIRINAYGITMPRYFVVTLAIFSTVTAALMWRVRKDTAVISVILLMTFITIAFFGPFSGYSLTLSSQTNQLEKLLETNNMLSNDGHLVPNPEASKAAQSDISEKITFLMDAYAVEQINLLPETFSGNNAKEYLGFDLLYYWNINQNAFERFNYFTKIPNQLIVLDGAEYMLNVGQFDTIDKMALSNGLSIEKTLEMLTVKENDTTILTVDLSENAAAFYLDQNKPQIITSQDQKVKLTLVYLNIDGQITSDTAPVVTDDLKVEYYDVRILIDLLP